MSMGLLPRVVLFAGLLGLGLTGGILARERMAQGSPPTAKVDGVPVPEGRDLRSFVAERAETLLSRTVRLTLDGDDVTSLALGRASPPAVPVRATLGDLGVTVDVDAVLARVTRPWTEPDLLLRYFPVDRGDLDVPLEIGLDADRALSLVRRVKEERDVAPVSARLDLDTKAAIAERPGRYVDFDGAIEAFLEAARRPEIDTIALPSRAFPPRVSQAFAATLDVNQTLGEFETYFSRAGDQARRGKNIDVAAQKIDGLVLSPGELVSFNDVVGERSVDNGFAKSWEICKGEMVEGVGGGTCQVASTFYATLFFGGMDVIERLPHSRPSAYIPMGLDATVVYPIVDLKVRNPYDFPVVIRAKTSGNALKMQLFGAAKPALVTFQRDLVDTFPYRRKVVKDPRLRGSAKVVMKQHGIRGYKIRRTRVVVQKDGSRRLDTNTDLYPATTEIYEVPPEFDETLLPPLPDAEKDDDDDDRAMAPKTVGSDPPALPAVRDTTATPVASSRPSSFDLVEGAGAHPPTEAQRNPPKTLRLTR